MLWVSLLSTLSLALGAAANSGIYDNSGNVKTVEVSQSPRALRYERSGTLGLTNGERLKLGQPLLQPKIRKVAARAPEVSCASAIRNFGNIQVTRVSTGAVIGFIRQTYDGQNSYTFGPLAQAAVVQLPTSQTGAFEITHVNSPSPAFPFVGAVGGSGGYNFSPGQLGYAYLAGTGHTPPNSPPSATAGTSLQSLGYNGPSESSIWSIACSGELSAQWTNAAGAAQSQPPTSFFYDGAVDFLGLIGDYAKFESTFPGEGSYLVSLKFIPVLS